MRFVSFSSILALATAALANFVNCTPSRRCAALDKRVAATPELVGTPSNMADGTAYGRETIANKGSLLGSATYSKDNNLNVTMKALSSTDVGGTWTVTVLSAIATDESDTHDFDNTYILQLLGGRILGAYRNHDTQGKGNYTYYRITLSASDDRGKSWTFPSQAAEQPAKPPPNNNGLWEPFLRLTSSGVIQIYYSRENNATDLDLIMSTSTDQGATWSTAVVVIGAAKSDARDGMIGIAPNGASGHLLAVFESEQNNLFQVQKSESSDDGKTWGPRGPVYASSNGLNAQSPQDEAVKIVTSGDEGNTWSSKLTVAPPPAFWPGLCTTGNETFLVIYGTNVVQAQNVTLS